MDRARSISNGIQFVCFCDCVEEGKANTVPVRELMLELLQLRQTAKKKEKEKERANSRLEFLPRECAVSELLLFEIQCFH